MFQSDNDQVSSPLLSSRHSHQQPNILELIPQPNPIYLKSSVPFLLDKTIQPSHRIKPPSVNIIKTSNPHPTKARPDCLVQEFNSSPLVYWKNQVRNKKVVFESNFESGNLQMVMQRQGELWCLISKDSNSQNYGHWFYFSVQGLRGTRRILPFKKKKSLYEKGMQICVCRAGNWVRGGSNIKYQHFRTINQVDYYSLSFEMDFGKGDQPTFLAYSFPYGFSQLQRLIKSFENNLYSKRLLKVQILTESLLQKPIYLLSIKENLSKKKPMILITARQHPGQSVGSMMAEGLLRFLLSENPESKALRQAYDFEILPMLNPDGVVLGNYRFSFSGCDLNRRWNLPTVQLFPQIYALKKRISTHSRTQEFAYIIDLHGHSRKDSYFFYGCIDNPNNQRPKYLPFVLSQQSRMCSFDNSHFKISKEKENTLRCSLFRLFEGARKVPLIYTLQASFMGVQGKQWLRSDYQQIGVQLLKGIKNLSLNKKLDSSYWKEIQKLQLFNQETLSQSGSDSNPSFGEIVEPDLEAFNFIVPRLKDRQHSHSAKPVKFVDKQLQIKSEKTYNRILIKSPEIKPISLKNDLNYQLENDDRSRSVKARTTLTQNSRKRVSTNKTSDRQRDSMNIATVYFGQHGQRGQLKCLMVNKQEQKQVRKISGQCVSRSQISPKFFPKGYNIKKIKLLNSRRETIKSRLSNSRPHAFINPT